jgi:hypothetical protein
VLDAIFQTSPPARIPRSSLSGRPRTHSVYKHSGSGGVEGEEDEGHESGGSLSCSAPPTSQPITMMSPSPRQPLPNNTSHAHGSNGGLKDSSSGWTGGSTGAGSSNGRQAGLLQMQLHQHHEGAGANGSHKGSANGAAGATPVRRAGSSTGGGGGWAVSSDGSSPPPPEPQRVLTGFDIAPPGPRSGASDRGPGLPPAAGRQPSVGHTTLSILPNSSSAQGSEGAGTSGNNLGLAVERLDTQ